MYLMLCTREYISRACERKRGGVDRRRGISRYSLHPILCRIKSLECRRRRWLVHEKKGWFVQLVSCRSNTRQKFGRRGILIDFRINRFFSVISIEFREIVMIRGKLGHLEVTCNRFSKQTDLQADVSGRNNRYIVRFLHPVTLIFFP